MVKRYLLHDIIKNFPVDGNGDGVTEFVSHEDYAALELATSKWRDLYGQEIESHVETKLNLEAECERLREEVATLKLALASLSHNLGEETREPS